jgi:hypothetical protein
MNGIPLLNATAAGQRDTLRFPVDLRDVSEALSVYAGGGETWISCNSELI